MVEWVSQLGLLSAPPFVASPQLPKAHPRAPPLELEALALMG